MTDVSEAEGWARGLDEVVARRAPRFGRVEPRRRASAYLRGLLAPLGRKNGWALPRGGGRPPPPRGAGARARAGGGRGPSPPRGGGAGRGAPPAPGGGGPGPLGDLGGGGCRC